MIPLAQTVSIYRQMFIEENAYDKNKPLHISQTNTIKTSDTFLLHALLLSASV